MEYCRRNVLVGLSVPVVTLTLLAACDRRRPEGAPPPGPKPVPPAKPSPRVGAPLPDLPPIEEYPKTDGNTR